MSEPGMTEVGAKVCGIKLIGNKRKKVINNYYYSKRELRSLERFFRESGGTWFS